ncbi:putative ribonuclease H-like superfamily [Helianthus annuus]|uniref:Putative ribonuclease H-like domain-containing protein n=1 Tax=Helianthus annuus TaxID=4232 RepID=A0A251T6Y4_HELAN|nr:putative ribonuclease H-like superfamily [Helianthus annuus]KAJ0863311.1 putative ribonuclease H-like superfamily [Helianthus annuus]
MHASLVSKVRNELSVCPGQICVTSECWSSIVTDGYISLTAHFIDSEWVLHKKILNFSYMPPPHNGVSLAEKIHTLVAYWGIDKKLLSLTLDNASANDICVNILRSQLKLKDALVYDGALFHIRCCAHILNLIVQEGLKKIDVSVDKVRECVKYIKGSHIRKNSFRKCISLDDKKGLLQDVPTRWNSTYKMLSSALYYQLSFYQLELSDSNFKCCPSLEEWKRIETICCFLEIFDNATKAFSGSYYTTSTLYFPHVFRIQLKLVEACKSSDTFMKQIAE